MSVVGLSPSDIVNGVVLAARAIQALKVVNGSQGQFQQANQNVALRIDALKALDDLATSLGTSSSSNRIRDVVKEVLDEEVKSKGKLAWYDQRLGPQAPVGKRHGIPAKLKWAFSGAKEQEERSNRSVPGIDAAIIGSILLGAETSKSRDEEHSAALTAAAASIQSHAGTCGNNASAKITNMESNIRAWLDGNVTKMQHYTEACAADVITKQAKTEDRSRTQTDHSKAEILSKIQSTEGSLTSFFAGHVDNLQKGVDSFDTRMRMLEQRLKEISGSQQESFHTSREQNLLITQEIKDLCARLSSTTRHLPRGLARLDPKPQDVPSAIISCPQKNRTLQSQYYATVVKATMLTASCGLYGHPFSKRTIRLLMARLSCDPILALLIAFAGYFLARCFTDFSIPPSIGGFSTLRSSDPFATWPRLDERIRRPLSATGMLTGALYIFTLPQEGNLIRIGRTTSTVERRMREWEHHCGIKLQIVLAMAGIKSVSRAESLVLEELQLARRKGLCKGRCGLRHDQLFEIKALVAIKVVCQIIERMKAISPERFE